MFDKLGDSIQDAYIVGPSLWIFSTSMSLIILFLLGAVYFWYRNRLRAMLQDGQDVADLAQKKDQLQAEIQRCDEWIKTSREELLRLDAERKQQEDLRIQLADLLGKVAQGQQKVDDLARESEAIQAAVVTLSQDKDSLSKERGLLSQQIEGFKAVFDTNKRAAEEATQKVQKLTEELSLLEKRQKEETDKLNALLKATTELDIKKQSLTIEVSAKEQQRDQLRNEIEESSKILSKLRADVSSLERLKEELKKLEGEVATLNDKKQQVEQEFNAYKRQEFNAAENVRTLEGQIKKLEERKGILGDDSQRYLDLVEVEPPCLDEGAFTGERSQNEVEVEAIRRFQESLDNQNLIFHDRVIKAFHTSLKISSINPVTVLAGVSGTGKTLLPMKYAQAFGMHSLVISVQPRWDSPHDLFGFYNYLEHRYKATDLSRALVRMDPYNFKKVNKSDDRMLLVLLDEMNLARVEYYFSEFLSRLELRRDVGNPGESHQRARAEIELEMGPQKERGENRVWVGENVLFVGTMNEDESTQTLSDKVLDRANVLRFGKPAGLESINRQSNRGTKEASGYLSFKSWKNWHRKADFKFDGSNEVGQWIVQLNDALEQIGKPFGHRVQQSIREYVANYPGITSHGEYKKAMADQIEQKVLPKLRGIDRQDAQAALSGIESVIMDLGDDDLSFTFKKAVENTTGLFVWRGVTRSIDR